MHHIFTLAKSGSNSKHTSQSYKTHSSSRHSWIPQSLVKKPPKPPLLSPARRATGATLAVSQYARTLHSLTHDTTRPVVVECANELVALPVELIARVMSFLSSRDRVRLAQVSSLARHKRPSRVRATYHCATPGLPSAIWHLQQRARRGVRRRKRSRER